MKINFIKLVLIFIFAHCFAHHVAGFTNQQAPATIPPFKLLIYYGYPSLISVNGSKSPLGNLTAIAQALSEYDVIVLGGGLEASTHPDNANTLSIITQFHQLKPSALVFGYIDLGVSTSNYTIAQIQTFAQQWKAMGVQGIFWDDAGYDFNTTRPRQTSAIVYARSLGLVSFMNAFNPDDIFSNAVNVANNPTGAPTALSSSDWFLLESLPFNSQAYAANGGWMTPSTLIAIVQKAQNWRAAYGTNIAAAAVVDYSSLAAANKQYIRNITQAVGFVCSFNAYGDCALSYSASGANANQIFKGWWDLEMARYGALESSLLYNPSATTISRQDYETIVTMNASKWIASTPLSSSPMSAYGS